MDLVVVTDARFINEARAIVDRGGEIWRLRRGDVELPHASERDIWSTPMDGLVTTEIDNRGTILNTSLQVAAALNARAGVAP